MLVKIVFVALFASTTLVDGAADVLSSFAQDEIVPNILETAPTTLLVVRYGDKRQVALGGELSTDDVAHEPSALEWPADKNALYTVMKVDPDAPSRLQPTRRSWLHWLIVNVPGDRLADGQTLASYRGAGPPPKSGLHRYVFLVFKQSARIDTPLEGVGDSKRANFDVRAFMKRHSLGTPLAGNYYQAKNAKQ